MFRHINTMPMTKSFLDKVLDRHGPEMIFPIPKIDKHGPSWKKLADKYLLVVMQAIYKGDSTGNWALFAAQVANAARRQDFHLKTKDLDQELPYIATVDRLIDEGILEIMPLEKRTIQLICSGQYETDDAVDLLLKLEQALVTAKQQQEELLKVPKKSPGRVAVPFNTYSKICSWFQNHTLRLPCRRSKRL